MKATQIFRHIFDKCFLAYQNSACYQGHTGHMTVFVPSQKIKQIRKLIQGCNKEIEKTIRDSKQTITPL